MTTTATPATTINLNLTVAPPVQPVIDIAVSASSRLLAMMGEKQLAGYGLRVFVSGGGCSGLQYGMTFDDEVRDGDAVWEANGLKVMVDAVSTRYLRGATISYQQDNMLAGAFKIDNPNATSGCGCGHSFRARGDDGAAEDDGYDRPSGGGCGSCSHG
ncbi:MAG: iron-sulfur cluster assembly accessory protein [Chloroflexi bacterium]|nr:iron-sulfur cluster assembly accessory protein [Chloroflexota bacterium]